MRTARGRRDFRVECLEDRNLLSAARPAGITAEVRRFVAPTPVSAFQGHVVGLQASDGMFSATLTGNTSYSGHGTARPLGSVYLGGQHFQFTDTTTSPPSLQLANGSAILTTIRGDELTLAYVGIGQTVSRGSQVVQLQGLVTGGTGRFDAVTGTFSGTATIRNGRFTLDFGIVLDEPR